WWRVLKEQRHLLQHLRLIALDNEEVLAVGGANLCAHRVLTLERVTSHHPRGQRHHPRGQRPPPQERWGDAQLRPRLLLGQLGLVGAAAGGMVPLTPLCASTRPVCT